MRTNTAFYPELSPPAESPPSFALGRDSAVGWRDGKLVAGKGAGSGVPQRWLSARGSRKQTHRRGASYVIALGSLLTFCGWSPKYQLGSMDKTDSHQPSPDDSALTVRRSERVAAGWWLRVLSSYVVLPLSVF